MFKAFCKPQVFKFFNSHAFKRYAARICETMSSFRCKNTRPTASPWASQPRLSTEAAWRLPLLPPSPPSPPPSARPASTLCQARPRPTSSLCLAMRCQAPCSSPAFLCWAAGPPSSPSTRLWRPRRDVVRPITVRPRRPTATSSCPFPPERWRTPWERRWRRGRSLRGPGMKLGHGQLRASMKCCFWEQFRIDF